MDDDIWNELMRLRNPPHGLGEQKSWDTLLNYFLIMHHGNGDWKKKVKEVDIKLHDEFKKEISEMTFEELTIKNINVMYALLERKYYSEFIKKQNSLLEEE